MEPADHPRDLGVGIPEARLQIFTKGPEQLVAAGLQGLELGAVFGPSGLGDPARSSGRGFLVLEGGAGGAQIGEHAIQATVLAGEQFVGALDHLATQSHARGDRGRR